MIHTSQEIRGWVSFYSLGTGGSQLTELMEEGDGLGKALCVWGVSSDSRPHLSLGDRQVTVGSRPLPSGQASSLCLSAKKAGGAWPAAPMPCTAGTPGSVLGRLSWAERVACLAHGFRMKVFSALLHGVPLQPALCPEGVAVDFGRVGSSLGSASVPASGSSLSCSCCLTTQTRKGPSIPLPHIHITCCAARRGGSGRQTSWVEE